MKRCESNPIITRAEIRSSHPALRDVSSVFNPGGIMHQGRFLLLLRVQNRARETWLMKAVSDDGIRFDISTDPVSFSGLEACPHRIYHIYDPRITRLDNEYHVICAIDTDAGCFLVWFVTGDFETLRFKGLVSEPEVRNGVLFPERIEERFLRFERPNHKQMQDGVKSGSTIICSASPDMLKWERVGSVMHGNPHYWDELIGSGPPPIKTRQGWLHIYHGVATHFGSSNIYQAGISLQDLNEPWLTVARGRYNILEPRESYELTGQVPNVVFPSAAIPLETEADGSVLDDTKVYIYYGAADTCIGMVEATIAELIGAVYAK